MKQSKMNSQTYKLAAFPLNIIVLPGEEVPLRIFEPRYKQLISECLEYSTSFGIPYVSNKFMTQIGSEVEVVKVVGRNSSNDMVINIRGKSLYKILDYSPVLPAKLYGGTISETLPESFETTNPEIAIRVKYLKLNIDPTLGTLIISNSINMLDIARALMLKSEEKYCFINLNGSSEREQFIINQLKFIEQIRLQEKLLENNFQLN